MFTFFKWKIIKKFNYSIFDYYNYHNYNLFNYYQNKELSSEKALNFMFFYPNLDDNNDLNTLNKNDIIIILIIVIIILMKE